MFIVNNRRWFFALSAILVIGSIFALFNYDLKLSTDFTGGSILEVEYVPTRPTLEGLEGVLKNAEVGESTIQAVGETSYLIRLRTLTETEHAKLLADLKTLEPKSELTEKRFSSVGPVLGRELFRKGIVSLIVVAILILIYVAIVFRKVSHGGKNHRDGVSSWAYGAVAIITMVHDVLIPTGIFVMLGVYWGVEIDALFLTAFLTILGLSVNDKIVALDRIRENLSRQASAETFAETVGRSLRETMARSINTSITVIAVLLIIVIFGAATTRYFALAMALGMIVATYSSIFIAAPLLVAWNNRKQKS
ncbi:MAG: protein translocase subunit SecF [Patescibacteria group bacterium]